MLLSHTSAYLMAVVVTLVMLQVNDFVRVRHLGA